MCKARRLCKTPYVMAIVVFVVAAVLLLVLRPPMVHSPGKTDVEKGKLSIVRVTVWSLIAAILVLVVPMVWRKFR